MLLRFQVEGDHTGPDAAIARIGVAVRENAAAA
jgi:hypothetical protein